MNFLAETKEIACVKVGVYLPWRRRNEQRQYQQQVEVNPSRARSCQSPAARRCSTGECDLGEFRLALSFLYINAAIACPDLTPGEKLVLVILANHADDKGFCFPSYGTLAQECSMTRRAVIRIVRALEVKQLLKRKKRFPSNGYNLLVTVCHQRGKGVVTQKTQVVTLQALGGDPMSPKPSVPVTINTKVFSKVNGELNHQPDPDKWKKQLARYSKGDFSEDMPTISA